MTNKSKKKSKKGKKVIFSVLVVLVLVSIIAISGGETKSPEDRALDRCTGMFRTMVNVQDAGRDDLQSADYEGFVERCSAELEEVGKYFSDIICRRSTDGCMWNE